MNPQLKVFTIQEANEALVKIIPLLEQIRVLREAILKLEVEIDALEMISEKKDPPAASPFQSRIEEYTRRVNEFYAAVESLHQTGCLLKDLDAGLVDFHAHHQGHLVFLCWKLGEPKVAHWHEMDSGFASRQPLSGDK